MNYTLEFSSGLEAKASCLLKWTFIGASLLSAIELTLTVQRQSSARGRQVCITLCDIFYVLYNVLTVALYLCGHAVGLSGISNTDVAVAVAVVWITTVAVLQRWRSFCVSNLPPLLHACCFVAALTNLLMWKDTLPSHQIFPHGHQNHGALEMSFYSFVTFAALGSFVCSFFRCSPVLYKATSEVNPAADEDSLSPCGKLVGLVAIRHIINVARLSKLVEEDIRPTIRRLKCRHLISRLYNPLHQKWHGRSAGTRVTCAFVRVLWCEVLWVLLIGFAYSATQMVRVPLLEALIEDIGSQEAITITMLFIAACTAEVCLAGFAEYVSRRLCVQFKFLAQAALFSKMTRMSASALSETPAGYLLSVVSVDVEKMSIAINMFARDTCGILSLPVLLWVLSNRVGSLPVAGCIGWQLVGLIIYFVASKLQASLWSTLCKVFPLHPHGIRYLSVSKEDGMPYDLAMALGLHCIWRSRTARLYGDVDACSAKEYFRERKNIIHHRDDRLRKMADTLTCVRLLKFYAWEDAVADAVSRYRNKEGYFIFLDNMLDGILDSLQNSASSVMTIILFGSVVAVNGSGNLNPAYIFSSLYMLSIVEVMLINLQVALRYRSMAWQGLKRLAKVLTAEEAESEATATVDRKFAAGTVLLEKCLFTWTGPEGTKEQPGQGEIALCDVNLDAKPGALVGVVGLVGSGKTALLEAMLGQLRCHRGTMHVCGRVAYVPQAACIFNMSVRDNVLFGRAMEPDRYCQVLEACELTNDLAMLPAGDLTEVGERGETLSGGQKQRVALARAAYSDSDVYLMDDTLSALDVHVAARVFKQVIGRKGLLRDKTRIVISNQGLFLTRMEKLVLLWEKRAMTFNFLSELSADSRAPKTLLLGRRPQSTTPKDRESGWDPYQMTEDATLGKITSDEVCDMNLGTMDLLRSLATMSGPCLPLALLSLAARAATVGFFLYWIKLWTDTIASADDAGQSDAVWIVVLSILCLCDLVLGSIGGCLLAFSCRRLSAHLHAAMLRRLLSCAVSFFEATPRGRILNRFSADLDQVDSLLCLTAKTVVQTFSLTFARLVVVGTQAPAACVFGAMAIAVFLVVAAVSVRAANALRSLESARWSRVLQHLTETRDSITTVRCFGAVTLFQKRFYRLLDDIVRPHWAMFACMRLMRVSGAMAGLFSILVAMATLVLSNPPPSKSGVGLALSAVMSVPMILAQVNASLFFVILAAIAFERTLEYTRLTPEDDFFTDTNKKPKPTITPRFAPKRKDRDTWPQKGEIVFENFSASYKPGVLPPVLNNLSFVIKPNEKVGVVGRTGAGKSSLILALLRVLRPSCGRIVIDKADISSVALRKLRSVITVIPQEPYLMKGSLRDNLDGMRCHSDEQVWEALKKAHMANFVSSHPCGLLLEVDDGAENLSAGQRQLLCLARALLRAPRVLLLDEATSRLDGDTDRLIQQTLNEGFVASTVLTVAHRLHTVLHCDRILVMKDGSVAEFGSVGDLAANSNSVFSAMARAAGIDLSTFAKSAPFVRLK